MHVFKALTAELRDSIFIKRELVRAHVHVLGSKSDCLSVTLLFRVVVFM